MDLEFLFKGKNETKDALNRCDKKLVAPKTAFQACQQFLKKYGKQFSKICPQNPEIKIIKKLNSKETFRPARNIRIQNLF